MKKYKVRLNYDMHTSIQTVILDDDEEPMEDYEILLQAWKQLKAPWRSAYSRDSEIIDIQEEKQHEKSSQNNLE